MLAVRRLHSGILGVVALTSLGLITSCDDGRPTDPVVDRILLAPGGGQGGGPKVDATDPTWAEQDTTLDVRVLGSGYDHGSVATFTRDGVAGPKVRTNSTRFVSSRELVANITIALDAETDLYDVEVMTTRGKKGIGADMFAVVEKGTGPPPGDPVAVFEYPADETGLKIVSDGRQEFLSEDGQWFVYESGVCGVFGRFYGSGDAIMDPDKNWKNLGRVKKLCGAPRVVSISYDMPADGDPPPDPVVQRLGAYHNMHELWQMVPGETIETAAGFNAGMCLLRFKPEPDHNANFYPGSDKVMATRLNDSTWVVETKPYPDNKAYCVGDGRFYHLPFRLRVMMREPSDHKFK